MVKILGYEINRARIAATPRTPSVKKGLEIGDSGTPFLFGIVRDEYNAKLADMNGVKIYDEMRRSDGTIRAAVSVCSLPIRSAKWYVEPASEDQADKDIADFVWKELQRIPVDHMERLIAARVVVS